MTIRQELVETEETVIADVPICDGCGDEVNLDDPEATTWTPDESEDAEAVHTCPTCDVQNLTRTRQSALGRHLPTGLLDHGLGVPSLPTVRGRLQHPAFALGSGLMGVVMIGIALSPVVTTPFAYFILFVLGVLGGAGTLIVSLAESYDVSGQSPNEVHLFIPAGAICGLFFVSSPYLAWGTVIASIWMAASYTFAFYELDSL